MSPDELLRELGDLATSLGPAVRPAGRPAPTSCCVR